MKHQIQTQINVKEVKIPNKPSPNRSRVTITLDDPILDYLEEWAKREDRKTRTEWMGVLLKRAVEKDKAGEIVNGVTLDSTDFEQVKRFIALLSGKEKRNNISFALVAKCLGLDQDNIKDLYLMVLSMREVRKLVVEPPPDYEWKLVKKDKKK